MSTAPSVSAPTTTVAKAVIARLETHGVRHVFGIPGTHNLPLYEALSESSITHVAPRHEQGAGYAADGYARASGQAAVCLVTSGPGVTNVLTAVATAHADSVPMLVVCPAMPGDVTGRDTGFLHELKNQRGLMERVLTHSVRAHAPQEAVAAIDEAFSCFAAGRPRPFYLEVPLDLLDSSGKVIAAEPAHLATHSPEESLVDRAGDLLLGANAPAIVLGGGAKDAGSAALSLARQLGAPVVTTVNGKGVVSELDPLSLGASIRLRCIQDFLRERDVVLAVGTELAESDLWRKPPLGLKGQLIRVDVDPSQAHKNAAAEVAIAADARLAFEALVNRVSESGEAARESDLRQLRLTAREEARGDGLQYESLMAELGGALDPDAVVASDSTMACYYGAVHFLPLEGPRQLLYPTGYATLGYGLPAAIGAKLALGERQVMALMGDGGMMFTLQELATAVELRLSLPVVIVHNGGYGEIRRGMVERGMRPMAVDFDPPDFTALAKALGAQGVKAASYTDVGAHVERAFGVRGPTVIEVEEES